MRKLRTLARNAFAILSTTALLVTALAATGMASYVEQPGGVAPRPRPPEPPRPPMPPIRPLHVPELAEYLDRIEIGGPAFCRSLAVFPLTLRGGDVLDGPWLAMDEALRRGLLIVTEKGRGSVPEIVMENRSRRDSILIVAGEVVSGGKQTRTIRQDIILAPGQRIEVGVYCVEQHRWEGGERFEPSGRMVPQSVQKEVRAGASQDSIWSEVARSNAALGADSPTGSIERSLNSPEVSRQLEAARDAIAPRCPRESVGFIFVHRGQAVGAEFFGRADLARTLLPKLIDAYACDYVLPDKGNEYMRPSGRSTAEWFLGRIRGAGSWHAATPGSGVGIRTRAAGSMGDGVGFEDALVHFGVQPEVLIPREPPWRE